MIRPAEPWDVPALAGIAERSYRAAFQAILEPAILDARNAAFFAARFRETLDRLALAETEERPTGFLLMTDNHIDMLFVEPDDSGRGVGSALLAYAEAKGATSLECFSANHPARGFYARHGWILTRSYERAFAGRHRGFVLFEKARAVTPARSGS
jgi:putative acetyltransferase